MLGFGCCSGLMVSVLDWGHSVVFLGKTPNHSHNASLHSDGLASHPGGSGNTVLLVSTCNVNQG